MNAEPYALQNIRPSYRALQIVHNFQMTLNTFTKCMQMAIARASAQLPTCLAMHVHAHPHAIDSTTIYYNNNIVQRYDNAYDSADLGCPTKRQHASVLGTIEQCNLIDNYSPFRHCIDSAGHCRLIILMYQLS